MPWPIHDNNDTEPDFDADFDHLAEFYAYLELEDLGCGYSIACGKKLYSLKSQTKEEAIEEVKSIITTESWQKFGQCKITIFHVTGGTEINPCEIKSWRDESNQKLKFKEEFEQEQRERQEYERLKLKFDR